jgi:hypothetical protein
MLDFSHCQDKRAAGFKQPRQQFRIPGRIEGIAPKRTAQGVLEPKGCGGVAQHFLDFVHARSLSG